jgi:hypothetical protein
MDRLTFSYNWNNKLQNKAFTTIRKAIPEHYPLDKVFDVYLKNEFIKQVRVEDTKLCLLSKLPSYTCFLDTGYCREETISMFKKMHHLTEGQDIQMLLILLVTTTA